MAEVLDDVRLGYVLQLDQMARVSSVTGVMDEFAAWVPQVWSMLDAARAARREAS